MVEGDRQPRVGIKTDARQARERKNRSQTSADAPFPRLEPLPPIFPSDCVPSPQQVSPRNPLFLILLRFKSRAYSTTVTHPAPWTGSSDAEPLSVFLLPR